MRQSLQSDQVASPEQVLYRLVQDYIQGNLDDSQVLYRAVVVRIDMEGGQLELDPPNPRYSIQARVITNNFNSSTAENDLPIFWPMFPHAQAPLKENEHVYIIFEDSAKQHGLWLSRLPQRLDVDSKNYVNGDDAYLKNELNEATQQNVTQKVAGSRKNVTSSEIDSAFVVEDTPDFKARIGDHVIQGSNNTIIVLGRDRPGAADDPSAMRSNAGTIDIVAGRKSVEMSDADASRVYVSTASDIDKNMDIATIGAKGTSGVGAVKCIGVKSDHIRIVARKGLKIVVNGGDMILEGKNIVIGDKASQAAVLGNELTDLLSQLIDAIKAISVNTPAGPSVAPVVNAGQFEALQKKLSNVLSSAVTVKK